MVVPAQINPLLSSQIEVTSLDEIENKLSGSFLNWIKESSAELYLFNPPAPVPIHIVPVDDS